MKKVLVTGATGFIGNHVIQVLLHKGYTVIATSCNKENAQSESWFGNVQYEEFDLKSIDDSINYFHYFHQPDVMIHLAWEGLPNYKNDFHIIENLPRHKAFLKNLLQNGLKDITVTGTCFEYGLKDGCLSEETVCEPANAYAVAKNELRKWLMNLSAELAFNFKWTRLFYMYGKGQNPNSLISQLEKALADNEPFFNMSGGEQVRDFLPVEKLAEYIVAIALQQNITGVINCCSAAPVRVKDFIENYMKEKGMNIKLNLGYYNYTEIEPMSFWGDNKILKQLLANEQSNSAI